ncbi:hypothetical protein [Agromyces aureus]|uniref:hypothetical protein n=1 Tax=Agromyces aureus TaxID=453304 RepID=UPI000A78F94B|nr:hypothetical protein [Agromyces aureus]
MAWHSSNRRATLPKDWTTVRKRIRARADGMCEHRTNGRRCTNPGTECHHIGSATDHRDEMLEWICSDCHKVETQKQARAQQHAKYTAAKKRPTEAHPGIRTRKP